MSEQLKEEIAVFCCNILKLRKNARLSQVEMAKKLRIGVRSLRKLEKGELPPRLGCEIVVYLCKEFSIEPHQLFLPSDL